MNNGADNNPQAVRSTFVTVVAWVFIVISGFATLVAVVQSIVAFLLFRDADMQAAMDQAAANQWISTAAKSFFIGAVIVFGTTLISAIGLLERKNWARLVFVGLLSIGILWTIAVLIFQMGIFQFSPDVPPGTPADVRSSYETAATAISIVSAIMTAVIAVLFGWIIKRLLSSDIKREFQTSRLRLS